MTELHAYSSRRIESRLLPGLSAVIRMADDEGLLPRIKDQENAVAVLDCVFADDNTPTTADAERIWSFCQKSLGNASVEHIVAQCQAGVGRSVAVCMALARHLGQHWEQRHVYNRTLYRLLLAQAGLTPEPEPRVSLAVRVKYDAETFMGFLISLRRQRYSNWEVFAFTDGLRPDIRQLLDLFPDSNVVLVENSEPRGRWGHPYRQAALELCQGEWIGTNNDDNYLTPGYIEQMAYAGEQSGASLVLCHAVHRYSAWGVTKAGQDLGCWLARRELVERVRWTRTDFLADEAYLDQLITLAGGKVAEIPRTLLVKN